MYNVTFECKYSHVSLLSLLKTMKQVKRRLYSSLCSTVHVGFNTVRLAEIYNQRTTVPSPSNENVGYLSIVDTGGQTTISGSGKIFERFLSTGWVDTFSGYGTKPVTFLEKSFLCAPLRKMNFDETYYGMHYDCRKSKHLLMSCETKRKNNTFGKIITSLSIPAKTIIEFLIILFF